MTKDRGTDADEAFVASRRDLRDKEIWNLISVRDARELEERAAVIMVKDISVLKGRVQRKRG
jgi:hypothetical protein